MITDHITTVPPDPRFSFKHAVHDGRTVIMSGEKSFIGKVVFDPGASCRDDESCYSGIPLNTKTGKEWLEGMCELIMKSMFESFFFHHINIFIYSIIFFQDCLWGQVLLKLM